MVRNRLFQVVDPNAAQDCTKTLYAMQIIFLALLRKSDLIHRKHLRGIPLLLFNLFKSRM
jgi:hypothetical protein